jgi:hypothetical protein
MAMTNEPKDTAASLVGSWRNAEIARRLFTIVNETNPHACASERNLLFATVRDVLDPGNPRLFCGHLIVAAAIKLGPLVISLPRPARHPDILRAMLEAGMSGIVHPDHQGFLTDGGLFVSRAEGAVIALEAGQAIPRGTDLFSEDLW